jgi:ABC-type glycerol-3-phosphate transport system substrate-binding protein
MKRRIGAFILVAVLLAVTAGQAASVSGAAFTTFNAHVDGAGKDVCKNSAIDCNIYGAKEYV